MKQIKGKCEFVIIDPNNPTCFPELRKENVCNSVRSCSKCVESFKNRDIYFDPIMFYCRDDSWYASEVFMLSAITESECALFVEPLTYAPSMYDDMNTSVIKPNETAKESLVSLLKANGMLCKSMGVVTPLDVMFAHERSDVNITKIPDDFLIIKTK